MNDKEVKDAITYWKTVAAHDYDTMTALFKAKRYSDSLFFGHIVIEKLLKGLIVKNTTEQAPYTHNLMVLERAAKLESDKDMIEFLNQVNDFNIRARYPEHKLAFYKKCTYQYTKYYERIKEIYKNLCQKLK